jgi:hypothetical protein
MQSLISDSRAMERMMLVDGVKGSLDPQHFILFVAGTGFSFVDVDKFERVMLPRNEAHSESLKAELHRTGTLQRVVVANENTYTFEFTYTDEEMTVKVYGVSENPLYADRRVLNVFHQEDVFDQFIDLLRDEGIESNTSTIAAMMASQPIHSRYWRIGFRVLPGSMHVVDYDMAAMATEFERYFPSAELDFSLGEGMTRRRCNIIANGCKYLFEVETTFSHRTMEYSATVAVTGVFDDDFMREGRHKFDGVGSFGVFLLHLASMVTGDDRLYEVDDSRSLRRMMRVDGVRSVASEFLEFRMASQEDVLQMLADFDVAFESIDGEDATLDEHSGYSLRYIMVNGFEFEFNFRYERDYSEVLVRGVVEGSSAVGMNHRNRFPGVDNFNSFIMLLEDKLQYAKEADVQSVGGVEETEDEPETELNNACVICMQPLITRLCSTPCGHMFHINCLDRWEAIKSTCPMCRVHLP